MNIKQNIIILIVLFFFVAFMYNCTTNEKPAQIIQESPFERLIPHNLQATYKLADSSYQYYKYVFYKADSLMQSITELRLLERVTINNYIVKQIENEINKSEVDTNRLFLKAISGCITHQNKKFECLNAAVDALQKKKHNKEVASLRKSATELHEKCKPLPGIINGNYTIEEMLNFNRQYETAYELILKAVANSANISNAKLNAEIYRNKMPVYYSVFFYASQVLLTEEKLENLYSGNHSIFLINKGKQFEYLVGKFKTSDEALQLIEGLNYKNARIVFNIGSHEIYPYLNSDKEINSNAIYRIQVLALSSKADSATLKPFVFDDTKIICVQSDNLYKYYIGDFKTKEMADKYKAVKQLHNSFVSKIK